MVKDKDNPDKNGEKQRSRFQQTAVLPDITFLLIKSLGDQILTVVLDSYTSEADRMELYIDAVNRYGSENIRYCKVIPAKVQVSATFDES